MPNDAPRFLFKRELKRGVRLTVTTDPAYKMVQEECISEYAKNYNLAPNNWTDSRRAAHKAHVLSKWRGRLTFSANGQTGITFRTMDDYDRFIDDVATFVLSNS